MSLENIYYISQSFAVLAIVMSLIFVGIQVRQNSSQSEVAAAEAVHRSFSTWYLNVSDPEVSSIIVKALGNQSSLSASERWTFNCKLMPFLLSAQDAHMKWLEGSLSSERWRIWDGVAGYFFKAPGGVLMWNSRGYMFSDAFQAYAETKVAEEGIIPVGSHAWQEDFSQKPSTNPASKG